MIESCLSIVDPGEGGSGGLNSTTLLEVGPSLSFEEKGGGFRISHQIKILNLQDILTLKTHAVRPEIAIYICMSYLF